MFFHSTMCIFILYPVSILFVIFLCAFYFFGSGKRQLLVKCWKNKCQCYHKNQWNKASSIWILCVYLCRKEHCNGLTRLMHFNATAHYHVVIYFAISGCVLKTLLFCNHHTHTHNSLYFNCSWNSDYIHFELPDNSCNNENGQA